MVRKLALSGLLCLSFILVTTFGRAQWAFDPVQRESVLPKKGNLSEARKKWSWDLVQLLDETRLPPGRSHQKHADEMSRLKNLVLADEANHLKAKINGGRVHICIQLEPGTRPELIAPLLEQFKGYDASHDLLFGWIRIKDLDSLSSLPNVKGISTVLPPITQSGSIVTQGDLIHRSANVRNTYGQDGTGIRVGIISDGVDSRATAQASGDLPADGTGLTVLRNAVGGDEGTAMLEIVHDMVPGAQLLFHDMGTNPAEFNDAITALVNAGCDIICDDIAYIAEPFFEDGPIATHVKNFADANNVLFVSAAGNSAQAHNQGRFFPWNDSFWHSFSGGPSSMPGLYIHLDPGQTATIILQWDDRFGFSGNDYDLYLFALGDSPAIVSWSEQIQDGNDNPLEYIVFTNPLSVPWDFEIAVTRIPSAVIRNLEVFVYPETVVYPFNVRPEDSIFGHRAVTGVLAVGAIAADHPGNDDIEPFSSQGLSTISWPTAEARSKPDICGIDGVAVSGAGGFSNPFYGTSAAAPHVAAVAAQLWAQVPWETPAEIRSRLRASAVPLRSESPFYHNPFWGWGRADAWNATQTLFSSLSVAKAGSGTISSTPGGISCGTDCSESYFLGTVVTLTASPAAGWTFAGWSGACSGGATTCEVTMGQAKSVLATFTVLGCTYSLGSYTTPVVFAGGPGSVSITTSAGCPWTATTSVPWISLTGATQGLGDGVVEYQVAHNGTGSRRSGIIIIAGLTLTIDQSSWGFPLITSQPQDVTISSGQSAQLSVTAIGQNAFSSLNYQWYRYGPGGESEPISGAQSNTYSTGPLTTTTVYWVRVWDGNGSSGSRLATVIISGETFMLTVTKAGSGTGTVSSDPPGISCGSICSAQFAYNTVVTLSAEGDAGSTFDRWSGLGSCLFGPCRVSMTQARNLTATFSEVPSCSWSNAANMPTARVGSLAGIAVVRNKITVIGSQEGNPGTGRINEEFDHAINTWTVKNPYPRPEGRIALNSDAVVGDKIYLLGGSGLSANEMARSVDTYDPVTDTWQLNVAAYPIPVGGLSTAVLNQKIYCFGGQNYNQPGYRLAYRFDPINRTFAPLANPPVGRVFAKSMVHGAEIWVAGGMDISPAYTVRDTIDIYDPVSDTWSPGPYLPRSDKMLNWLGYLVDGRIYAVYSDTTPVIYRYRSDSGDWEEVCRAPLAQDNFGVAAVSNNIFIIGGGGEPKLSTVQVFSVPNHISTNIARYYRTVLRREPDVSGARYWTAETERVAGLGIHLREGFQAAAKIFFNSQEYMQQGRTDEQFVEDLYRTFLDRDPDPAGKAFWVDYLAQGLTRNMLITQFAYSEEFSLLLEGIFGSSVSRPENNLLNDLYRGFLGRFPDSAGFDGWLSQLRQAQCQGGQAVIDLVHSITLGFIESEEYWLRLRKNSQFVEDLYNAILRRGADPAGFAGWVSELETRSRAEILREFTNSAEFQFRVQEIIEAGCLP